MTDPIANLDPLPQIVFVIRLSIIPSHMSTAVFSTCDVKFWHFTVSTFVTLPKQLILVYLGVLLVGGQSDFWIKFGLFGVAGGVTVLAGVWIWYKMRTIKKELLARQTRCRADKESRLMASGGGLQPPSEDTPLGRNNSYQNLPQDASPRPYPQQQNSFGNDYGYQAAQETSGSTTRTSSPKQEYHAFSPPASSGTSGYGQAQTTPYPDDNDGDLGTYGRVEFPTVQDSPEQKKVVHPYGFV